MLDIAFAQPALPTAGALVLLVAESAAEPAAHEALFAAADEATGGTLTRAVAVAEFRGKVGQATTILAPSAALTRVILVGVGKPGELTKLQAEEAGGHAAAALAREATASVDASALSPELAAHVALGAAVRGYRFDRYRTAEKAEDKRLLAKLTVLTANIDAAAAAWAPLKGVAGGVFLARDLASEPPNVLNPAEMAERCRALTSLGLEVEVLGPSELKKLGFGALLGVAQGSVNEARVVVMRWHGVSGPAKSGKGKKAGAAAAAARPQPVAFVGKGVTFDSGGISIKPAGGMEDMKWDMAGAGAVIGAMAALAGRQARVDAVGIVGLVENMPSGSAQRPGDVVTTLSGQTVEIINTDAEGRMVLADLLWYCQSQFNPKFMVDLATLTGAIIVSLGHEHGGMFSNDDALAAHLSQAGAASGEKLWRMPMGEAYDRQLKSDIADMKHVTGRPGSAITAAQFLLRFANAKPWAHLDIAGMAWSSKDAACVPKGATAYGVRLLDQMVAEHYEG